MSEQSTEKEIHIHNEFFFTHNKEMQFKVKKNWIALHPMLEEVFICITFLDSVW